MTDILPITGGTSHVLAKPRQDLLGEVPSDQEEQPKHPIENFFNVRLSLGFEYVRVFDLPESVRHVHAYHRPEETYTLPANTGGFLTNFDFGVGMHFVDFFEMALDFVYRDNWTASYGKSSLWNDIETPATDYVGYRLNGMSLRPGVLFNFYKSTRSRAFIKISYVNEWARLSSGTDAYVTYPSGAEGGIQFHRQNSVELPEKVSMEAVYRSCLSGLDSFTGKKPCGLLGELGAAFSLPVQGNPTEFGLKFLSLGLVYRPPHDL